MNLSSRPFFGLLLVLFAACVGQPLRAPEPGDPQAAPVAPSAAAPPPPNEAWDSRSAMIFLLIGQSNMVGTPRPEAADELEDPRVRVLAYEDCPPLGRSYNQWAPAKAPLHGCYGGVGPGDYFARELGKVYPKAGIGLVPLGISGVDIDFFVKGVVSKRRGEFRIPPDNHWAGAYEWVIERARLAQAAGTIRGIVFHQGESDTGSAEWAPKVQKLVADLRANLALGNAPFVAGELLHDGCCGKWHNPLLPELPKLIENSAVVSASGLAGMDRAHFDLPAQRELGQRYGSAMLALLGPVPERP